MRKCGGDISRFSSAARTAEQERLARAEGNSLPSLPGEFQAQQNASKLSPVASFYGINFCAIGNGRPNPNAREVILRPGADCLRLYSVRSTSDAMSRTSFISNPYFSAISCGLFKSSM